MTREERGSPAYCRLCLFPAALFIGLTSGVLWLGVAWALRFLGVL